MPEHLDRAPEILADALPGILIAVAGVHASLATRLVSVPTDTPAEADTR